jgi:hypothetical protein
MTLFQFPPGLGDKAHRLVLAHSLLVVHLVILFALLAFGAWVYAGKLTAAGDDLNNIGTAYWASNLDYLRYFYMEWGQTGVILLVIPLRALARFFQLGPDTFPWWLFASASSYCNLVAPLMIVAAGKAVLRYHWKVGLFLLAFIFGVWIGPAVYRTTVNIPVTFFVAYVLPLFLTLFAIATFTRPCSGRVGKFIVAALYLIVSVNTQTFFFSAPVLFTTLTAIKVIRGNRSYWIGLKEIGLWAMLTLVAAIFVWTQPGFHKREVGAKFVMPSAAELGAWYQKSTQMGYGTLFSNHLPHTLWIHSLVLVAIAVGLAGTSLVYYQLGQHKNQPNPAARDLLGSGILALGFLMAFHFSWISLLFTPYFPEYTQVYPDLLLAAGLGYSIWWASQVYPWLVQCLSKMAWSRSLPDNPERAVSEGRWSFAILFGALIGFGWIGSRVLLPNIGQIGAAFTHELRYSEIRRDVRQKIETLHATEGANNFLVVDSPADVDPSWGFTGYFGWKGHPEITAAIDGDIVLVSKGYDGYFSGKNWTRVSTNP